MFTETSLFLTVQKAVQTNEHLSKTDTFPASSLTSINTKFLYLVALIDNLDFFF